MFTRVPGTIREVDEDGDDDPAVTPAPSEITLTNESGIVLTTEDGTEITL